MGAMLNAAVVQLWIGGSRLGLVDEGSPSRTPGRIRMECKAYMSRMTMSTYYMCIICLYHIF